MRLVKIGLASMSPTVGATRSNADRVIACARELAAQDATIACFPEQVLGGYPPEDLVHWAGFIAAQREAVERIARETADLPTVLVLGLNVGVDGQIFNVAAVLHAGRILAFVPKEELPTYDIFYEARTLAHGGRGLALDADGVPLGDYIFRFDFGTLAVEVCEDAWSPDGPMRRRCFSGAELVINISASPYRIGIDATRREMLATRSADNLATLAYCNRVGGQDGLVFDGGGYIFQAGRLLLAAPRFREQHATCTVDLDRARRLRRENTTWRRDCEAFQRTEPRVPTLHSDAPTADRTRLAYPAPRPSELFLPPATSPTSPREARLDELFEALALGVKEYFQKTGAFRCLGVALSGGRDSLLTLLIGWRAAQLILEAAPERERHARLPQLLRALYMPTRYSRPETREAATTICQELGIPLTISPIDEALEREAEATRAAVDTPELTPITRQNIQARLRAARMWNWANEVGALFLQTSDMSEKAAGYTTIGGDLEGGLSVIANVPKTVVIALLQHLQARYGFQGIGLTLQTVPGPELAEEQAAEAELMPFPVLDACLYLYAAEKLTPAEALTALQAMFPEHPPERLATWARRFATLFTRSIYKWVQSPLSLHVGSLDLERERALQLPVVQRTEWHDHET